MRLNQRSCFIGNVVKLVFRLFSVFGNDDGDGVAGDGVTGDGVAGDGGNESERRQLSQRERRLFHSSS